jgi:hypothetical protein
MAAKRRQTRRQFLSHSDIASFSSLCVLLRGKFPAVRCFESRKLPNTFQQSVFGSEFILFLSTFVCFHFIGLSIRPPSFVSFLSVELPAPSVSSSVFSKLLPFFLYSVLSFLRFLLPLCISLLLSFFSHCIKFF